MSEHPSSTPFIDSGSKDKYGKKPLQSWVGKVASYDTQKDQIENGFTTLIEAMINQELGEPFRRDAMTAPVAVAGIDAKDMRPQQV